MREIKFRAWDGKSIFCPDWLDNTTNCDPYDDGGWNNPEGHYVDGEYPACILMQSTGLKDKNGKECYWDDWVSDGINPKFLVIPDYHLLARLSEIEFEIVGNKYETP